MMLKMKKSEFSFLGQGLRFHLIESGGCNYCVVASWQSGCPHSKAARSSMMPMDNLFKSNSRGLLRPLVDD